MQNANRPTFSGGVSCVLLVDDDDATCELLKRTMKPLGARLLVGKSVEEALALLLDNAIDVVVSDMRIAGRSGAELLEEISKRYPHIHRILLTAYGDAKDTLGAIRAGLADDFLTKPWDNAHLLDCVRRTGRGHTARFRRPF